jgi:hypothetical protein
MTTFINGLDIPKLEQLVSIISKQREVKNGNIKQMVKPYLEFDTGIIALKEMITPSRKKR